MPVKRCLLPFQWEHVREVPYKEGTKKILLIEGRDVEMRYFELAPGTSSQHEAHEHEHAVYVLRGKGSVLLGETVYPLSPHDVVHVPSMETHQFINEGEEPFGFLCIIQTKKTR